MLTLNSIISIKLINSGKVSKIINDSFFNDLIITVNNVTYTSLNMSNSIRALGQTITLEYENDLYNCCEGMFNNQNISIIEEINISLENNISSLKNMFLDQVKLKKINLTNLKTDNVVDMSSMFQNCESIEEVDLSGNDFGKVNNMEKMFYQNKNIEKIKFPSTSFIDLNMNYMFAYCDNLKSVNLSLFQISKDIYLENIFINSLNLEEIEMPKINVNKSINMDNLFSNLTSLSSIEFNTDYSYILVNSSKNMFYNCKELISLNLSIIKLYEIENMSHMFDGCMFNFF